MSDDALLSWPAGHYGAGYGDPTVHHGMGGPLFHDAFHGAFHDEHHQHYQQFRREHEQRLDEDYAAWRRERFEGDFGGWRSGRQASLAQRDEGPLASLGRAVSDTVTGTREPELERLDAPSAR